MSDMDFGREAGASCALHPEQVATGTCARCGNFMCDTCSQGGTSPRCPTCRARFGAEFPLNRDNWSIGGLWEVCWPIFQREWGMLSLAVLISFGVSFGSQLLVTLGQGIGSALDSTVLAVVLSLVGFLAQLVVQGLVQLGLLRVCFDVLQGGRADVARLFSQMHKVGPYLLTMLVVFAIIVVPLLILGALGFLVAMGAGFGGDMPWNMDADTSPAARWDAVAPVLAVMGGVSAVLLIPFIYVTLPLYFVQPELAYEDVPPGPLQLLRRCWEYARGQRLAMVGVGFLVGAIALAGFFACCVGLIPAMALAQLLISGMYLALRPRSDEVAGPLHG
ncbi:hypothetical protein D7X74_03990 [Corallococcus sp. CA047B]|uniref:hypothetical protein n=1 Tax=Corallococcus sp. CA047B TaxID=2316729 RepID=UPI000EA26A1B|nr:hypothetical protein [Corallococcus sp. CA047B]RKH20444.1 hypothetical protein D7X74_03990 [Corallococcus sp. CA047B]